MWTHIGKPGSNSDGGVFKDTKLKQHLQAGSLPLPAPCPLPGDPRDDAHPIPHFGIGDDAFPLRTWLMKPSLTKEQHTYNYRIRRA